MADSITKGKVQPKQTKAMDMRFHWLCNQECQQQFRVYWLPGKVNYAKNIIQNHIILTCGKNFSPAHHSQNFTDGTTKLCSLRSIESGHNNGTWQGCDDLNL
jgi:hypothetical protein